MRDGGVAIIHLHGGGPKCDYTIGNLYFRTQNWYFYTNLEICIGKRLNTLYCDIQSGKRKNKI